MRKTRTNPDITGAFDACVVGLVRGDPATPMPQGLPRGLALLAASRIGGSPTPSFQAYLADQLEAQALAPPTRYPRRRPLAARNLRLAFTATLTLAMVAAGAAALFLGREGARAPEVSAAEILLKAQSAPANLSATAVSRFTMVVHHRLVATAAPADGGDGRPHTVHEVELRRWVDGPDRWRTELELFRYDADGNREPGQLAQVLVGDGAIRSIYDAQSGTVQQEPYTGADPANTALGMGTVSVTTGAASIEAALEAAAECHDPVLKGTETIIGRKAWVIELGADRCAPAAAGINRTTFRPSTVWVDTETFLTLKWLSTSPSIPNMYQVSEIVSLELDPDIDPARFTFAPPQP